MSKHDHNHTCDNSCDHQLDESLTYKDFMTALKINDLPHRDYAAMIPYVKFIDIKQDICKFFVPNKYNGYNTYIQFTDWNEQLNDGSISSTEAARLLLWSGDIKFWCGCPAFSFWGMSYILTQLDASIHEETRFPHIRNPHLKGLLCKHGKRTMMTLGFQLGHIAAAIKKQRLDL